MKDRWPFLIKVHLSFTLCDGKVVFMNLKQRTFLICALLSIVIVAGIFYFIIHRQESAFLKFQMDLPDLRADNLDSDIGKWIIPAIMKGESLNKEFIEEHVYILRFRMTASEAVRNISFTIFYYIDNQLIARTYQVENHGLMEVTTETGRNSDYERLLSVITFNDIFKSVNKDTITNLFGIKHSIEMAEIDLISRLENIEISKERTAVLNNQFIPFGDISPDGNYAVCFITFVGGSSGSNLPFLIPIY